MRPLVLSSLVLLCGCDADETEDPWAADTEPSVTRPQDTGQDPDDSDPPDTDEDTAVELWEIEWDEACNPLSVGDDCLLPYPSLHYMVSDESSPTGLRMDIDVEDFYSPDGELPVDPAMFDFADGVSRVSSMLVNFGVDIDPAFLSGWGEQGDTVLPGAPIALIHAETGEAVPILTEMDQNNRDYKGYEARHPLIIRPLGPMELGARYVVLLSDSLTDVDGLSLQSPDVFVALRDGIPTDDEVVEGMRPRFDAFFEVAEKAGWTREDLLLAWDFQVASEEFSLGPIRSMRAQTLELIEKQGVDYVIESVEADPNEHVAWLVKGTFTPPGFLTADNDLQRDEEGGILLQKDWFDYDFTMVIPPQAKKQGGLPLVLIGHGLFGTGEWMLDSGTAESLIHPMASETGAVLVATDWIGLSSGDIDLIISEVITDMSRITVVTDRLVQSHINNIALVELTLGELPDDPAIGRQVKDPLVDPDNIWYYGISLGGIQGASQVSVSPRISRATLAVPGSGWSHMIQRSVHFSYLDKLIDVLYPDPLTQNLFIAAIQTYFDFSDPAVLGSLLNNDPELPEAPQKTVLLQEGIGDCQVPNIATDLLSRTLGAAHLEYATDPVYGLETIKGPTTATSLTQIRVPDDLKAYWPPDQNTIPETDNGVHDDAVLQEVAFEQVKWLFLQGENIHTCDGECDPD